MTENSHDGPDGRNAHIDVTDPSDLRHWTRELQVDERTLKAAIREAGPSVSAIRDFLRTSRSR